MYFGTGLFFYVQNERSWNVIDKDIFNDFKELVGCEYISDLPNKKEEVFELMERVRFSDYSLEQVTEFLDYVF